MKKLTKTLFKRQVLKEGYITLDADGQCTFVVTQINDENFNDINPKLKQQLEDEGKYNSWISFITFNHQKPYTIQLLPIYGDQNKYVTKWFTNTAEKAIDQDLNDRQLKLLKRANEYQTKELI